MNLFELVLRAIFGAVLHATVLVPVENKLLPLVAALIRLDHAPDAVRSS